MARLPDEDFESILRAKDWPRLVTEARRARAAEAHYKNAIAAQMRAAVEEVEQLNALLARQKEGVAATIEKRDAADAAVEGLKQPEK